MRVLRKIFSVLCFAAVAACFVTCGSAFAEDKNYYELNLYDKNSTSDFSAADNDAYLWIFDNHGHYEWVVEESTEYDYLSDGDLLITILHCLDVECAVEVNPDLTDSDNRVFDFSDEQKEDLELDYPGLAGYDGVALNVAPEYDCESVCVASVKNKTIPFGANQKSNPSIDGLNVNLDLYFSRINERFEYELLLINNTEDDLRISFDNNDAYVGYEVDSGDAKLPAHSRKKIVVKVFIKGDIPSDVLDDENTFTSSFVILLDNDNADNPNTSMSGLPIVLLLASGLTIALLASKNRRGAKTVAIVAFFGFALFLPAVSVFASAKYEVTVNVRIEYEKKNLLTLLPNAENVEEGGDKIERLVKPDEWVVLTGGEFYRFGYLLDSWNSKPDGSGDYYYNEDSEYQFDKDVTLYVVWDPAYYVTLTDDEEVLTVSDQPFGDYNWRQGPYHEHFMIYQLRDVEHWGRGLNPFQRSYSMYGCASDSLNDVNEVHINGRFAAKNMSSLFQYTGCWNATDNEVFRMDLSGLDTSETATMAEMFSSVGSGRVRGFKDWSIGDLSGWDVSKVTDMSSMFSGAGTAAQSWTVGDLSGWDVANVKNMSSMFSSVGSMASSIDLGNIKNWNVSNVEDMNHMFYGFGYHRLENCSLDLNGWNTSSLTDATRMFENMCREANSFALDISSFDMSKVTDMSLMLTGAGNDATSWTVKIPKTNGNGLANTTTRIYGANESVYFDAPEGRSFTLAD